MTLQEMQARYEVISDELASLLETYDSGDKTVEPAIREWDVKYSEEYDILQLYLTDG